ncbi:MAG: hypothetical protein ABIP63_07825, partial [Thermoanaerobaculia bacterium]
MHEHLSNDLVDRYRERRLSPSELRAFFAHTSDCNLCAEKALGDSPAHATAALRKTLEQDPHDHLSHDELVRWIEQSSSNDECDLVEARIAACSV